MSQKDIKLFLVDAFYLIIYSMYSLIELYAYFVFLGVFCLEKGSFNIWLVLVLFLIFHLITTTKIIFYMQMFITEGRSTLEIFPHTISNDPQEDFRSINPFIVDSMLNNSIEKTQSCEFCMTYKPPRAHHCKRCDRCYLKHDHHCIFLDTCVGFHNYKFFYQFLVINFISIVYFLTVLLFDLIFRPRFPVYLISNYAVAMSFYLIEGSINLSLLIFHTQLISRNETTIECVALNSYLRGDNTFLYVFQEGLIKNFSDCKDRTVLNPYNLGTRQNWIEVFGKKRNEWFKPSFSSLGDGVSFKTNQDDDKEMI